MTVILLFSAAPGSAQTLRYGNQGDLKLLDPYTLNEVTTLAHLGHVYEGLVARDKNLNIVPALAESWETPEPTRWRFHLRRGVKFHNGDDFTADDVVFSANRVRAKGSNMQSRMPMDAKVMKVDDYTVDFVLSSPDPILLAQWATWYIMDKKWAEAKQFFGADTGLGYVAEPCLVACKWDWSFRHSESPAWCAHCISAQPILVAQTGRA